MLSRVLKTIARVPRQINPLDTAQWAASGFLAGALARVAYNKLKKRRKLTDGVLKWSLLGAGLGLGGYALNRNAVEMMGGVAQDPKKLIKGINDGSNEHLFYVPGATKLTGMYKNDQKSPKGVHIIPFDEADRVASEIDKLPEDQKVTIVGHSAGGGGAYNLAGKVNRRIDKLVTLDPVQTNLAKFVRDLATGHKKPDNVVLWENYAPTTLKMKTRANAYVRYLLTRLDDYRLAADRNIRLDQEDHSMRSTGLRVDEWVTKQLTNLYNNIYKSGV